MFAIIGSFSVVNLKAVISCILAIYLNEVESILRDISEPYGISSSLGCSGFFLNESRTHEGQKLSVFSKLIQQLYGDILCEARAKLKIDLDPTEFVKEPEKMEIWFKMIGHNVGEYQNELLAQSKGVADIVCCLNHLNIEMRPLNYFSFLELPYFGPALGSLQDFLTKAMNLVRFRS